MNSVHLARFSSLVVALGLAACSGGGDASGSLGGEFLVLQTDPLDNARLYLNDPISFDFSKGVDLSSVNLNTFSFQVLNQSSTQVYEPVAGFFEIATSPGDIEPGRRLNFVPQFPTNNTFDNGGFRPGRTYIVQLVGGSVVNHTVIQATDGDPLGLPVSLRVSTADGATPAELFRNVTLGGPRRAALDITPTPSASGVVLNKLGQAPLEIRLRFDQALNPNTDNVPTDVETNPLLRSSTARGRIFLEFDDAVWGVNQWIPAEVELEANNREGGVVVLRPIGVLPNNSQVRVIVESTLEDISGESNVSNAAYDRVFGTFRTQRAYEQQFDGLVENFLSAEAIDLTAAFGEPVAEVGAGYIKAGFAYEGSATAIEYEPLRSNTVLNTNFTQVEPKVGSPYNVSGGVFNFKNVHIPAGVTVQGQGSNPMVFLVTGSVLVDGTLSVRGTDGTLVGTSATANLAKEGGMGVCGGGDGGDGSPSATARDLAGGTGNGPLQLAAGGGGGGTMPCLAGCTRASGGGGGSLATQGDPNYKQKTVPAGANNPPNPEPIFPQQNGIGGSGCDGAAGTVTRVQPGGVPGPAVFVDARTDNNFWGSAIKLSPTGNLRIPGEMVVLIGGGGGGGGGDLSYNGSCSTNDVNFQNDSSGGGGGGGGGVLVVKALGPIVINESGRVTADGGNGGGGEQGGSCSRAGGGGGGAGGMVLLMSATRIDIHAHGVGSNYGYYQNDYSFAVSADGGVCRTGTFGTPVVNGKYPGSGQAVMAGSTYDSKPLGGLGGMGIVQLMAPPGTNADNTNTILDDNVRIFRQALEQTGANKRQLLAWRGFPNAAGQLVDDFNVATNIGDNEGEIRPSPILIPVPFGAKSRLRSHWLDTGTSVRRGILADDNLPRGVITSSGALVGPTYRFSGTDATPAATTLGYANYAATGANSENAQVVYSTFGSDFAVFALYPTASYLGQPVYQIELTSAALPSVVDQLVQHEVELLDASGTPLRRGVDGSIGTAVEGDKISYRVLTHTSRLLTLDVAGGVLPTLSQVGKVRIVEKFFACSTNGKEGLGATYPGSVGQARVPNANVRIGFAFHQDPASATAQRYPAQAGTFAYDLSNPSVQETIRQLGARYVQWDIVFDCAFQSNVNDVPPALSPNTPFPSLQYLRLPFRF